MDRDNHVWAFHRHKDKPILRIDGKTGEPIQSFGADGMIENAHGLSIGPDGNIYPTDLKFHQVPVISPQGEILQRWGEKGKPGWDAKHFNLPTMAAFDPKGTVYVGDGYGNSRVARFSLPGEYLREWKSKELGRPWAIVAAPDGTFFVADGGDEADAKGEARSKAMHADGKGQILESWGS